MIAGFRLPGSVNTVHQSGAPLTPDSAGINLQFHFRDGARVPACVEVFSDDESEHAEIGLEFEGTELTGYDGAFDLPPAVLVAVKWLGFTVSPDLTEDAPRTVSREVLRAVVAAVDSGCLVMTGGDWNRTAVAAIDAARKELAK